MNEIGGSLEATVRTRGISWKKALAVFAAVPMLGVALVAGAWFSSFFDVLLPWYEILGVPVDFTMPLTWAQWLRGGASVVALSFAGLYPSERLRQSSYPRSSSALPDALVQWSAVTFYIIVAGWGWALLGEHWYSAIAGAILGRTVLGWLSRVGGSRRW